MPKLIVNQIETRGILSKSNLPVGDYSANPYIGCSHACKYCYACFMKRFSNHPEPWGEFLDIKRWQEIKNPQRYAGKEIFIGSVTDPYNPQEKTYKRARALLEQLKDSGAKISIATKSDLVLRDLDLIKSFPNARVSWSINTLEKSFQRDMDKAVSIERRFAAMKIFYDSGVRTACFISPIFPEITDVKAIINRAKSQCNAIWLENLNLRANYKAVIMNYIREKRPELLAIYQEIYDRKDRGYWIALDDDLRAFAAKIGLKYATHDDSLTRSFDAPPIIVNYFYHGLIKKSAKKPAIQNNHLVKSPYERAY